MITKCPTCGNNLASGDVGPIVMDDHLKGVMWRSIPIHFSPMHYNIVKHMVAAAGRPISRNNLQQLFFSRCASINSVNVAIMDIRKKFTQADQGFDRIVTANGLGYMWKSS